MSAPPKSPLWQMGRTAWLIIALAAGLRLAIALLLPIISKDGVTFCWYARELGLQGTAFLQTKDAAQHPLYPLFVLAAERVAVLAGAQRSPFTWQYAGQAVSLLAGIAVVILTGLLGRKLVRVLEVPVSERAALLGGLGLAAVIPLSVQLSADVMSDQMHLAFYIAAVLLLLDMRPVWSAAGAGLLSGCAFLTRPEGLMPLIGGLAAVAFLRLPVGARLTRAGLLLVAFGLVAGPYWGITGQLSPKKDVFDLLGDEARTPPTAQPMPECPQAPVAYARLETNDVAWYMAPPTVLYRVVQVGRLVIPAFALLPLLSLRRRLLRPPLLGLSTCLFGHLTLAALLLKHYDYLDGRHVLVAVTLLVPFAAVQLASLVTPRGDRGPRPTAVLVVALSLGLLTLYSLRLPNFADRHMRAAAADLLARHPGAAGQKLVSGASGRRLAFYADMHHERWLERLDRPRTLIRQLQRLPQGYFAIETGESGEASGNAAILQEVLADPQLAPRLRELPRMPAFKQNVLRRFEVLPTGASRPAE